MRFVVSEDDIDAAFRAWSMSQELPVAGGAMALPWVPGSYEERAAGRAFRAGWEAAEKHTAADRCCPEGCGCRLGTQDADARECGCDGPCTGGQE